MRPGPQVGLLRGFSGEFGRRLRECTRRTADYVSLFVRSESAEFCEELTVLRDVSETALEANSLDFKARDVGAFDDGIPNGIDDVRDLIDCTVETSDDLKHVVSFRKVLMAYALGALAPV
jgi:hypothetical protein